MADVPANYLLWLYESKNCFGQVLNYIVDNLEVIKSQIAREEYKYHKNE